MCACQRTLVLLPLVALVVMAQWLPTALGFYRGRPGSSLALAKRLETDLAGSEDDEYAGLPAGALEALEWRSRFPPAAVADISSFYPFFRPSSSALAKKNKDASRSMEAARGGNRKFQTQGWRR